MAVSLEEGFRDPPVSVRPKGYWDWINGNFDLEQLTVELEEARAQGNPVWIKFINSLTIR